MKDLFYAKLENNIIIEYPENTNNEQNYISLDYDLFQYCITLGKVEFTGELEDRIYTIRDKDLFIQCGVGIEILEKEAGTEEFMLEVEYRISKLELGV